ncbi:hypothetical protein THAOC_24322, partial [Thalassiosira oceanica]
ARERQLVLADPPDLGGASHDLEEQLYVRLSLPEQLEEGALHHPLVAPARFDRRQDRRGELHRGQRRGDAGARLVEPQGGREGILALARVAPGRFLCAAVSQGEGRPPSGSVLMDEVTQRLGEGEEQGGVLAVIANGTVGRVRVELAED